MLGGVREDANLLGEEEGARSLCCCLSLTSATNQKRRGGKTSTFERPHLALSDGQARRPGLARRRGSAGVILRASSRIVQNNQTHYTTMSAEEPVASFAETDVEEHEIESNWEHVRC